MNCLYLIRVPVAMDRLARWAGDRGWIRRGHQTYEFDEGRALHHLVDELFGPRQLRPFRLLVAPGAVVANLYAYSQQDHERLQELGRIHGLPEYASVIDIDRIQGKVMPTEWTVGQQVGFDLRVRPVRRLKSDQIVGGRQFKKGVELDAFLVEVTRQRSENGVWASAESQSREIVYLAWLEERLGEAAQLNRHATRLSRFRRNRVSRGESGSEGPDATFHGLLRIENVDLFQNLLEHGLGRHRAYGYGMLLLRPPGQLR